MFMMNWVGEVRLWSSLEAERMPPAAPYSKRYEIMSGDSEEQRDGGVLLAIGEGAVGEL